MSGQAATGSLAGELLRIGDLAQRTGTGKATIEPYLKLGLLEPARVENQGYRLFASDCVARLGLLKKARLVGFALPRCARCSTACRSTSWGTYSQICWRSDVATSCGHVVWASHRGRGYEVALLDTPPVLGFALSSAVLAAGWAIMPTATTQQDIDALVDTLAAIDELTEDEMLGARTLAIVPNAVHRDRPDQGGLAALNAAYAGLVTEPVPHSASVKRALNRHLPPSMTEPRAKPMDAYRALARRVSAAMSGIGKRREEAIVST